MILLLNGTSSWDEVLRSPHPLARFVTVAAHPQRRQKGIPHQRLSMVDHGEVDGSELENVDIK